MPSLASYYTVTAPRLSDASVSARNVAFPFSGVLSQVRPQVRPQDHQVPPATFTSPNAALVVISPLAFQTLPPSNQIDLPVFYQALTAEQNSPATYQLSLQGFRLIRLIFSNFFEFFLHNPPYPP